MNGARDPGLMREFAVLLPGMGHIYAGHWFPGILFLLLDAVAAALMFVGVAEGHSVFLYGLVGYVLTWVLNLLFLPKVGAAEGHTPSEVRQVQ
ncbi:MAG: hypothetical protein DIU70_006525 [Bacillota bacterium]